MRLVVLDRRPLSPQVTKAASSVATRLACLGATFAMTATAARLLHAHDAGRFFLLFALFNLSSTIARFGTDNLALKIAAATRLNLSALRRLSALCVSGSVVVTIIAGPAVLLFAPTSERLPALALLLSIPPSALAVFEGAILRGLGHPSWSAVLELGAMPALVTGGALLCKLGSVLTFSLAVCAAAWLTATAGAIVLRIKMRRSPRPLDTSVAPLRGYASSLIAMAGTSTLFYALTWSPVIALGLVSSSIEVAKLTVAMRLAAIITLAAQMQTTYLSSNFARNSMIGDHRSITRLALRSSQVSSLIAVPSGLALIVLAPQALALFGDGFTGAASTLQVLTVSSLVGVLAGPVNLLLLICDHERLAFRLNAVLVVASFSGCIGLGYAWGSLGGAIALGVSNITYVSTSSLLLARTRCIGTGILSSRLAGVR